MTKSAKQNSAMTDVKDGSHSGETSFAELARELLKHRVRFFLPIIVFLIVGILLAGVSRLRNTSETFSYTVQFNFSGVSELQYPNGKTFSLQDLVSPIVVDTVYENQIAGKYDISRETFRQGFSVSAYAPARQLILQRYKGVLNNRKISFAESQATQDSLLAELRKASRDAAILTFTNKGRRLPESAVNVSLQKIVEEWTHYSVKQKGVLELNIDVLEPSFLNDESLKSLGQINVLRGILSMHKKVSNYVKALNELEGAGALRDIDSGVTIESLKTRLDLLAGRVVDLARSWTFDEKRLESGLNNLLSTKAFTQEPLAGIAPQVAYDLLLERIEDIRKNIKAISNLNFGTAVPHKRDGLTIVDLDNVLNELETFQIKPIRDSVLSAGSSKNPDSVRAYYRQRIREFERERQKISALAGVVEQVDSRYDNTARATPENPTTTLGTSTVIPQFNDGFLDRLIDMSSKSDDTKFRQNLAKRSIELLDEVTVLDSKITGLKSDLALFDKGVASNSTTSSSDAPDFTNNLDGYLKLLSSYLDITVRIGQRIQNSDELIKVLINDLELNEDDPRLVRSTFLRGDDLSSMTVKDIINPLRGIVTVANRMNIELGKSLYGTRSLSTSIREPRRHRRPLIQIRDVIIIGVLGALGLLLGMLLVGLKLIRRRS